MADEEKKSAEIAENKSADAPKEDPSPTVSHSEPAAVHSGGAVPPLAADKAEHPDEHAHGAADHAHGGADHAHDDHAHSASGAEFGEVIPEKNWQDSFLAAVAAAVLCGFILVGIVWAGVQPPVETAPEENAATSTAPHLKPGEIPQPPPLIPRPSFIPDAPRRPAPHR
jgi:hypothetical protein